MTAASLNLVVIVTLNKVNMNRNISSMHTSPHHHQVDEYVAIWLVNWEQPRTQSDFEHSFTFKMFFFQFINYYSPLIYIASIKVKVLK